MTLLDHTLNRRSLMAGGVIATAGATVVGLIGPAFAQDASPAPDSGSSPLPAGAVLVAEGLWNPGDLAFGDDGTLYIAETGVAGLADLAATPNADGTPPAGPLPLVPPQISQVAHAGVQSVVTSEIGGVGIGFFSGSVYVSNGGSSVSLGITEQPAENTVSAFDIATGETRLLARIGPYETENNPDGLDVNCNLYGLGISAEGLIYVADAGGNTVYSIDSATGDFSLFTVVPNLTDLTGATPTADEEAIRSGPRRPVPTSIVIDNAGFIHVILLSENWNGPSVLTFAPDGTYTASVTGLSMIVNATLGPDGLIYVSQLSADFSGEMPTPGAVYRIEADGSALPVVEDLFYPHGIVFDGNGNLFVTTNSIISGPDAPLGMVLRFDGVAAMPA